MFHSFFILFLFHFSFLFFLSFFFLYIFVLFRAILLSSVSSLLSLWLASPGLLLSAGAAALLFVRECCWVSFEEGRNPESLGSLPLSINQAWPPLILYIYTHSVYTQQSWDAPSQQEVKMNSNGRACWKKKTREERLCFSSHHPQMFSSKYAMKVCVALS